MRRRPPERQQPEHLWAEGLRGIAMLVLVTAGVSLVRLLIAVVLAATAD